MTRVLVLMGFNDTTELKNGLLLYTTTTVETAVFKTRKAFDQYMIKNNYLRKYKKWQVDETDIIEEEIPRDTANTSSSPPSGLQT